MRASLLCCHLMLLIVFATVSVHASSDTTAPTAVDSMRALVVGAIGSAHSLPPILSFPGENISFNNIAYNRVDGLFVGVGSDKRYALRAFDTAVFGQFSLGYSLASHYWQVSAGAGVRFGRAAVGAEIYKRTESHDTWKIPLWENSIGALLAREDYLTWYRRNGIGTYIEYTPKRHIALSGRVSFDRYEPLPRSVEWSLFGGDKVFPSNPEFTSVYVRALTFSAYYSGLSALPGIPGVRAAFLSEYATYGDKNYIRSAVDIAVHCPIQRFVIVNSRMRIGGTAGDVFAPKLFTLGGVGTLPGHRPNEYNGNRMFLWNTEFIVPCAILSGHRIASSFSIIVFCDIGHVAMASHNSAITQALFPVHLGEMQSDIGIALGSAHGRLRAGLAWRTDRAAAPSFVLRFSPAIELAR